MIADRDQPASVSRRQLLAAASMGGLGASFGLMQAARALPFFGTTPASDPVADFPICRVNDAGEAAKGEARRIRFAYNGTGICTAAVPVALHRGYFTAQNLDVEFLQLAGTTDQMLQALATDKADAGCSMLLSWLKPLEQGIDVKLTTALHGGCTRLFVDAKSGIKDIRELKGKTIGVSSISGSPRNFFAILLSDAGLDPETDVQWREFPADILLLSLQRGEINAIADADPAAWLTHQRAHGAIVEIASNLSGDYADLSCCTLGIRSSLWASDPAAAAALTHAIRNAAHHVAEHLEDAAEIFSKYTPKVPVADLLAMLRSHTHTHHPTGEALKREVAKIAGDLKRASIIKPSTDPVKLANRVVVEIAG
jgi:NitT/TauT family transport system substrate-binding protein